MADVLEGTLKTYRRDIGAADWVARNLYAGVSENLYPSKLLDAVLKMKPDVMFARADKLHTLTRIYRESIADQARQKYALLQDSWAGEGANTFHYVWQRADQYVDTLGKKATEHANRCTDVGTAVNELRSASAAAVTAHLKNMYEWQKEYADAAKNTFSDFWNGVAGDPAKLLEMLTDGVGDFWRVTMQAGFAQADVIEKTITVTTAADAIPIIDTQHFAKTPDPNMKDFGDYTGGWKPEQVDGKPWDSR